MLKHGRWTGGQKQQRGEPLGSRAVQVALGLGEVEGQIVGPETGMKADLGQRNLLVGIGQLLQIVGAVQQGIVIDLGGTGLE